MVRVAFFGIVEGQSTNAAQVIYLFSVPNITEGAPHNMASAEKKKCVQSAHRKLPAIVR